MVVEKGGGVVVVIPVIPIPDSRVDPTPTVYTGQDDKNGNDGKQPEEGREAIEGAVGIIDLKAKGIRNDGCAHGDAPEGGGCIEGPFKPQKSTVISIRPTLRRLECLGSEGQQTIQGVCCPR